MIKFSLFLAAFALNFSLFAQFNSGDKLIGGNINGGFSQQPNGWGQQRVNAFNFGLNPTIHIWKNSRWSNSFSLNLNLNQTRYYGLQFINSSPTDYIYTNYTTGFGYQLRRWYKPLFDNKLSFYNHLSSSLDYRINEQKAVDNFGNNSTNTTPYLGLNVGLGAGALVKISNKWSLDFQLQPFSLNNSYNLKNERFSQEMNFNLSNLGWQVGVFYQLGNKKDKK